ALAQERAAEHLTEAHGRAKSAPSLAWTVAVQLSENCGERDLGLRLVASELVERELLLRADDEDPASAVPRHLAHDRPNHVEVVHLGFASQRLLAREAFERSPDRPGREDDVL